MPTRALYPFIAYGCFGLALMFLAAGILFWPHAADRQRNLVAVDATITTSQYTDVSASSARQCDRQFRWTYALNGVTYTSRVAFERIGRMRSCDAVRRLIETHPVGRQLRGFHDQRDPKRSFLYAHDDPILALYAPLFGLGLIGGLAMRRVYRGYGSAPALRRYGRWFALHATGSHAGKTQLWGWAASWMIVSLPPGLYWQRQLAVLPIVDHYVLWGGGAATLALVIAWATSRARSRAYSDPVVAVDRSPLRRGEPLRARIVQTFLTPVRVRSITLGVQCRYFVVGKIAQEVIAARSSEQCAVDRDYPAGGRLELEMEVQVPDGDDIDAIVPAARYWTLTVRCDGVGIADADVLFPIPVQ